MQHTFSNRGEPCRDDGSCAPPEQVQSHTPRAPALRQRHPHRTDGARDRRHRRQLHTPWNEDYIGSCQSPLGPDQWCAIRSCIFGTDCHSRTAARLGALGRLQSRALANHTCVFRGLHIRRCDSRLAPSTHEASRWCNGGGRCRRSAGGHNSADRGGWRRGSHSWN